jgi:hypothetical protein
VSDTATRLPLVDYLVLDNGEPHLVAEPVHVVRRAVLRSAQRMRGVLQDLVREGRHPAVRSGTRVHDRDVRGAGRAGAVRLRGHRLRTGTSVRGNIVGVDPTPENITLGMKVRLTTFPIGPTTTAPKRSASGSSPETRLT